MIRIKDTYMSFCKHKRLIRILFACLWYGILLVCIFSGLDWKLQRHHRIGNGDKAKFRLSSWYYTTTGFIKIKPDKKTEYSFTITNNTEKNSSGSAGWHLFDSNFEQIIPVRVIPNSDAYLLFPQNLVKDSELFVHTQHPEVWKVKNGSVALTKDSPRSVAKHIAPIKEVVEIGKHVLKVILKSKVNLKLAGGTKLCLSSMSGSIFYSATGFSVGKKSSRTYSLLANGMDSENQFNGKNWPECAVYAKPILSINPKSDDVIISPCEIKITDNEQ